MNIYVGNLSYRLRESDLREVFEEYGQVDACRIVTDRETRRSKGFAFLEMPDDREASRAIAELNEVELEGRKLIVKESQPREQYAPRKY
ncbi:MAG: RNA-binding protein [Prevotellaceae bacterium]|jgi:RNA recognition motif-containing protein|nr:RNA-binding protein [Prevotellaceae bacterium]